MPRGLEDTGAYPQGPKVADVVIEASGGLDHGAGHSLLLLCDAKTPRDKKSKEFKGLGDYLCNLSIGLL